jgi:hypothetical protein
MSGRGLKDEHSQAAGIRKEALRFQAQHGDGQVHTPCPVSSAAHSPVGHSARHRPVRGRAPAVAP